MLLAMRERPSSALTDVEAPDRRTWQEKFADFFTSPVTWIVIGCIVLVIIGIIIAYKIIMKYQYKEHSVMMNDEGVIEYKTVIHGEKVNLPFMKKDGYRFGGWFIDSAMTQPYIPTQPVKEDFMVYAKWIKEAD